MSLCNKPPHSQARGDESTLTLVEINIWVIIHKVNDLSVRHFPGIQSRYSELS